MAMTYAAVAAGESTANNLLNFQQYDSQVTALSGGRFLLTWATNDTAQDGSSAAIKARIFNADGSAAGGEFLVNTATADEQREPVAVQLADGRFVIAWTTLDPLQDGSYWSVKAQIFAANGTKLGGEFLVNTITTYEQHQPTMTALADGGFVIGWSSAFNVSGGTFGDVKAQVFTSAGTKLGSEFAVNTITSDQQAFADFATLANGNFVATWRTGSSLANFDVKAQIFTPVGGKVGGEFAVATATAGGQFGQEVIGFGDGRFLVVWSTADASQDGSGYAIKAQVFSASGVKIGGEFLVNTSVAGSQGEASVATLADGTVLVTWSSNVSGGSGATAATSSIVAQVIDSSGAKLGGEFLVQNQSTDFEQNSSVAVLSNGDFVIAWQDLRNYGTATEPDIAFRVYNASYAPELGAATVARAVAENTVSAGAVSAIDADGDPVSYAIIGGADASRFTINATSGALAFAAAPSFETPADANSDNIYEVVVRASDGTLSDEQTVLVTVSNVAEGPVFASSAAFTRTENGAVIGTVVATDGDGDQLIYSLAGGIDIAKFAIDAATGALRFIAAPDFEAPADANGDNVYQVTVRASDGGLSVDQIIAVSVTNANESPAIISPPALTMAENTSVAGVVAATDPEGVVLTYAIVGGADAALLSIDAATGALSFAATPNFEAPADADGDNVYAVTVSASDGASIATQAVTISVGDVAEAPLFSSASNQAAVENATAAGSVAASDPDGNPVEYAIVGGADAALLIIDAATGTLTFVTAPNFEAPADADGDNRYEITVSASDGGQTTIQAKTITVGNLAEAPVITSQTLFTTLENETAVGQLLASDPDGTTPSFAIAGGTDAARFTIDAATGALSFVAAPNFEAPGDADGNNVYQIVVSASDGVLTTSQTVDVSVSNVNEAPVITAFGGGSSATVSLGENVTAVATIAAADPDGTPLSYSLGGADAALFTIDALSGALSFRTAPDYESPADAGTDSTYDVVVTASDGSLSDSLTLAVSVANVNEAPVLTSFGGGASAAVGVAENSTFAGVPTARDPEGGFVTYAIVGGADAPLFALNSGSNAIRFLTSANFEAPGDANGDNVFEIVLRASDTSGNSSLQTLAITLTDVDEAPIIVSNGGGFSASTAIGENSTAVTTVVALDPEGAVPVYSVWGGLDAARFAIDAATGALRFIVAPNFEAPGDSDGDNVYVVAVAATVGSTMDIQSISIAVGNVNEAPTITSASAFSLAENGTAAATVTSTDPEGTPRTYAIAGGADAAKFAISSTTGALSFVAAPNFEAPVDTDGDNVYQVSVSASDGTLTTTQALSVTVGNANEAPVIVSGTTFAIAENASAVDSVVASDPDGTLSTYAISGGADAAKFTIDAASGALSFIAAPNFEAPTDADGNNVYQLSVSASDGTFAVIQAVTVVVGNVDEAPEIATTAFSAVENGVAAGTLAASDPDGATLSYAIIGGNDAARFVVDSATGALSFVAAPDYETPGDSDANNVYEFVVRVSDGTLATIRTVTVTIANANEAPVISSQTVFTVPEDVTAVATIVASDPESAPVTYAIGGGADATNFAIDAASGALRFVAAPNFDAPGDANADNLYDVIVVASDGLIASNKAITVAVTNVNEAPVIASNGGGDSATVNIAENGTAVSTVTSIDPEGTPQSYAITGGADAARFAINATTGALAFVAAPNFEAPADANGDNVYQIVVTASDGSLSDSQTLAITVTNVNETPTITSNGGGDSASITINENALAVMTVTSTDPEGVARTYSISGGADAAKFSINATTGGLSFVAAPNFEAPTDANGDNVYQVVVTANDGSLSDSQAIAVSVANVIDGLALTGTTKADTLTGGAAEDTINGLGGNDTLSGAGGADTINGGDGADTLIGGAGADRLTGGAGADTFTYQALGDSSVLLADFITDFSTAQGDKIGLSAIDANTGLAGDQAFSWIGTSVFSGVAGQLRYYQSGGDTFVTGDVNGDGLGDFLIQIDPLITLAPNNFFL